MDLYYLWYDSAGNSAPFNGFYCQESTDLHAAICFGAVYARRDGYIAVSAIFVSKHNEKIKHLTEELALLKAEEKYSNDTDN